MIANDPIPRHIVAVWVLVIANGRRNHFADRIIAALAYVASKAR